MAKKITPKHQISEGSKALRLLMLKSLSGIADRLIEQIIRKTKSLTPAQRLNAIKDLTVSGVNEYKQYLTEALAALTSDGLDLAKKEVPKAKKVQLAEIDDLSPTLRKKIKSQVGLTVDKQVSDLLSTISFAFSTNQDTTDSIDTLAGDLYEAAEDFVTGPAISAAASINAGKAVMEAREAFFFDKEVQEEIEAFEFVNGDPVTPICQDLAGTIFAKDDPDLFRYTPPLHWNCKSYIRPILVGNLKNREITKLKPSTKKIEDTIQFDESVDVFRNLKLDEKQR